MLKKIFENKTSFVTPKAMANNTSIKFMIFFLLFVENCLKYDTKHYFSVGFRTGFNLADSNRFRIHIGIVIDSFPWIIDKIKLRLKSVLLALMGRRLWLKKFYDFILLFVENCLKYDTMHGFSVWI